MTRTITIAGRELELAPLTLKQLRDLWPKMQDVGQKDVLASIDDGLDLIVLSLNKADATITRDSLQDLDLPSFRQAQEAVLEISGLRQAKGEAGPAPSGTGAASTAS